MSEHESILSEEHESVLPKEHEYKFDVKMTCGGCSKAVTRALSTLEGITEYNVNLETQEVVVKGPVDYETVLEKIKKTGKEVRSGEVVV